MSDPAAFKKYVHDRLDAAGVPADPEPEQNKAHGCRIEGRLNWMIQRQDDAVQLLSQTAKERNDAVSRLQLVAETPDLKRARKRIHEKTLEVAAVKHDIARVMQNSNMAVANVLNTVKGMCQIASGDRTPEDEARLRSMASTLMRLPLPYLLNGQVKAATQAPKKQAVTATLGDAPAEPEAEPTSAPVAG